MNDIGIKKGLIFLELIYDGDISLLWGYQAIYRQC